MKQIIFRLCSRKAMSLTEIIMAMALLATAFIPIVGVMGTSMKATDKDDRTIKAVNLCQEKLNQALQFPFGILEPGPNGSKTYGDGGAVQELTSSGSSSKIVLRVGPENIDGFAYKAVLTVVDRPGSFNVPMYDPFQKSQNPTDPTKWGWSSEIRAYEGMFFQYTMTVTWQDKGDAKVKEYTLSSFKSRVRDTK
ncbi:MAG: type IV pilus modification PilV family protein [Candidatus Rifleibacteriota bacterium]